MYIESILKDGDGENLTTGAPTADGDVNNPGKVIPVNGLSHTWFNNVKAKINGTVIKSINNKYAYRGDLEMRLSFSREIKTRHLRMCSSDEEIVAFEDVDAGDLQWWNVVRNEAMTRNHSLMRRFHTSCNSKVICTIGHIHSTIFEQAKVLPPFTHLEVTFERNKEDFLLLSKLANPSYWLQMQWMVLYVQKINLR